MTARAWSPEAPYDSLNVTPLPASVFLKSAIRLLFAVFRMEKPPMLTSSFLLSPPGEAGWAHAEVLGRTETARAAAPIHLSGVVRVMGRAFRSGGHTRI